MDVNKEKLDKGYRIDVYTDKEIAVVVQAEKERIYLPENSSSESGYYTENYEGLKKTDYGYRLIHEGEINDFQVLG